MKFSRMGKFTLESLWASLCLPTWSFAVGIRHCRYIYSYSLNLSTLFVYMGFVDTCLYMKKRICPIISRLQGTHDDTSLIHGLVAFILFSL